MVAAIGFLVLVWEALARERVSLAKARVRTSLEWLHLHPPADHRFEELPKGYF